MNFRSKLLQESSGETSALNDILFILLFFFLIISTLANPNLIQVSVPKANSDAKAKQSIVVSIDSFQNVFIGTKPVLLDSLGAALAAKVDLNAVEQPTIVINGDKKANLDQVVHVMRVAKAMNLKTVIAVEKMK